MENLQLEHNQHQENSSKYPVRFLVHDIDIALNIGSLFRIADALGVEQIYLSGTSQTPPNRKIQKTSRSADKHVPFCYEKKPFELIKKLKFEGFTIISLEITPSSIDIMDITITNHEKICLIMGSENTGVSKELLSVSDKLVHIPMQGKNSSMNVTTACAIATFEIIRRLRC